MSSARWYPTPLTLPDGRVLVIGGVPDPGDAGKPWLGGVERDVAPGWRTGRNKRTHGLCILAAAWVVCRRCCLREAMQRPAAHSAGPRMLTGAQSGAPASSCTLLWLRAPLAVVH